MKKALLCLSLILVYANPGVSQCEPAKITFSPGEKITYYAAYNWGPVWVDAGEVTFSVEKSDCRGQDAWHLRATGTTYKAYDILFKVRDYYDSWVSPQTVHSLEFRRQIFEGGYMLQNNITFFRKHGYLLSNTKRPGKPIKTDTLKAGPCHFDMLASIYYVRSLDLKHMKEGTIHPITVVIDDSVFRINVKKLGEEVKANRDGARYPCLKLSATMVQGTIFKKDEEIIVWITDDVNKVPIIVEAKILVGTVKAYLKEARGLSQPLITVK